MNIRMDQKRKALFVLKSETEEPNNEAEIEDQMYFNIEPGSPERSRLNKED
jgi:hypothetical protein